MYQRQRCCGICNYFAENIFKRSEQGLGQLSTDLMVVTVGRGGSGHVQGCHCLYGGVHIDRSIDRIYQLTPVAEGVV